jgi:hypothetical protein
MDPDPGGPKHADPADPDPQHWNILTHVLICRSKAQFSC